MRDTGNVHPRVTLSLPLAIWRNSPPKALLTLFALWLIQGIKKVLYLFRQSQMALGLQPFLDQKRKIFLDDLERLPSGLGIFLDGKNTVHEMTASCMCDFLKEGGCDIQAGVMV